jgi:hypothetical protein
MSIAGACRPRAQVTPSAAPGAGCDAESTKPTASLPEAPWRRIDAQGEGADGEGFAAGILGGSRSKTNKNAPTTKASEMATRMNADRVVLDPRIEGGAIADLGGGVLSGMSTV